MTLKKKQADPSGLSRNKEQQHTHNKTTPLSLFILPSLGPFALTRTLTFSRLFLRLLFARRGRGAADKRPAGQIFFSLAHLPPLPLPRSVSLTGIDTDSPLLRPFLRSFPSLLCYGRVNETRVSGGERPRHLFAYVTHTFTDNCRYKRVEATEATLAFSFYQKQEKSNVLAIVRTYSMCSYSISTYCSRYYYALYSNSTVHTVYCSLLHGVYQYKFLFLDYVPYLSTYCTMYLCRGMRFLDISSALSDKHTSTTYLKTLNKNRYFLAKVTFLNCYKSCSHGL